MDLSSLFYSLGLSGFFSSRAFLPAFVTSLAMKYGDKIPMFGDLDFVQKAADNPSWFTNSYFMTALGILSLAELAADKSPELRALMDNGSVYLKTALSAATTYGLLSASDAQAAQDIISLAGFGDLVPACITGGITFFCSATRARVVSILSDADEDDSLGIRSFVSWCEEIWAFFGVWILLLIPLLVVTLIGVVYAFFFLLQKRHERKEEEAKVPCPSCGARIHTFATACYSCGAPVEAPKQLSFLGGILEETVADRPAHELRLLELKRSPLSGDRVSGRGVNLVCETDGVALWGDSDRTRRYMESVDARLLKVMLIGGLFGLVPIIGLIVGVVYYRFQLVAPYRRYLPAGKGFMVKWVIRLLFLALILLNLVPGVGLLSVPLMAFINHGFYRSAFRSLLKDAGKLPA